MNCAKMIKIVLSTAFLLMSITAVNARAITLTQSVDKTEMAFEDSVKFEITVEWNGPQFAYRFPKPLSPYIDRLKVGRYSSSISSTGQKESEVTIKKFTYVLEPTSGGLGLIDPITINYISWPDSIPGELVTEKVTIQIADQIIVKPSETSNIWYYLIGALVIVSGGATFFVLRSRAAKNKIPVKSPVDKALEELSKTKAESGSDLKKFQTGIYNLLSEFLEERYNIEIGGLSETGLAERLSKTSLNEKDKSALVNWLIQAERDKFRPIESSPGETVRLENDLRKFFENLKV